MPAPGQSLSWFFLLGVVAGSFRYVLSKKHPSRGDGAAYGIFAGIFFGCGVGTSALIIYGWILAREAGIRIPGYMAGICVLVVICIAWVVALRMVKRPTEAYRQHAEEIERRREQLRREREAAEAAEAEAAAKAEEEKRSLPRSFGTWGGQVRLGGERKADPPDRQGES